MCHALALVFSVLSAVPASAGSEEPARLDLANLFVSTKEGARVAPAVEALRGRRVRVVGFMARMEDAPKGAFYLTRHPVEADESGGGTADLPPHAVRVEVPRLAGEEIAWTPDLVEAVGTLAVGRAEDPEGRVSWLRVVLDAPVAAAFRDPAAPTRATESPRHLGGGIKPVAKYQEESP